VGAWVIRERKIMRLIIDKIILEGRRKKHV